MVIAIFVKLRKYIFHCSENYKNFNCKKMIQGK
jgi:hypothetical protein